MWRLRFDTLTVVMLIVVTGVSSMVHLYSVGYMSHDKSRARFMAYLSLFTFAMLMLVTADNLVQLFFGWEGVGVASYLLIGFWYKKDSAHTAAMKAFVVNRVGDFGFALGILAVYQIFGSIEFDVIFANSASAAGTDINFLGTAMPALEVAGILLFIGAMGKSAQLGLHTWLPDAMEGPTPVSALIHAATMVTAGVFMICRLSPMLEYALLSLDIITVVGAMTAIFAATVGFTQFDIKRVIAYSTCSQLGYMFFAAGVSAYPAAMFHLTTHAFFKALLFLGAGSVIHALSDEQDLRNMGGICSWRLLIMAFHGKPRASAEVMSHVHESPLVMTIPLFVLSVGAIFSGWLGYELFVGHDMARFWGSSILILPEHTAMENAHHVPKWVKLLPIVLAASGVLLAVLCYAVWTGIPAKAARALSPVHAFFFNKWYFDELYDIIFVRPAVRIGAFLWQRGDRDTIDGFGPDGLSGLVLRVSAAASRLQSGFVFHYAFAMLIGVVVLVTWYYLRFGGM